MGKVKVKNLSTFVIGINLPNVRFRRDLMPKKLHCRKMYLKNSITTLAARLLLRMVFYKLLLKMLNLRLKLV